MSRISVILKYATLTLGTCVLIQIVCDISVASLSQPNSSNFTPPLSEWLVWCAIAATACALGYTLVRRLHLRCATFALHTALVCILSGAVVTYYRGDTGTCTLSQGKVQFGYLTSQQKVAHFPFDLTLDSAKVIYHPNTKTAKDFVVYIQIRDKTHGEVRWGKISMNQIYRAGGYRLCLQTLNASANSCTLNVNHDPWGIGLTYAGYALLALSMIFFFTEKKSHWRRVIRANKAMLLPSFLSIGILSVLITYLMSTPDAGEQLPPVLDSPLLGIHIFTIITAYLLLLGVALLSITVLCLRGQDERVQTRCRALHTLCEIWLTPAVFLLAIGIFIGAIWANVSWGRYWGWDPKETWALVTLMVYALPMHRLSFPLFRNDKWFHLYCIIAFASILMTYFGVNHLLGGLHSYGG